MEQEASISKAKPLHLPVRTLTGHSLGSASGQSSGAHSHHKGVRGLPNPFPSRTMRVKPVGESIFPGVVPEAKVDPRAPYTAWSSGNLPARENSLPKLARRVHWASRTFSAEVRRR